MYFLFNRTTLQVFVTYLTGKPEPHRKKSHAVAWIGRGTDDDQILLAWPPRSPVATPCDFFLYGYIKDEVYL